MTARIDRFYAHKTAGIWSYRAACRAGVSGYFRAKQTRNRAAIGLPPTRY
jgi:hypothetical protein